MKLPKFLKSEAWKFFESPLPFLPFQHIQELVRLVIDEARKSRKFGLYLSKEHLEKEELFFLAIINRMWGVWHIRKIIHPEDVRRLISDLMWEHFKEEISYYFLLAQQQKEAVLNKYNCHLECVRERLIREIYTPNKKFHTD